ncbi:hypothetical protein [Streptomyces clavuligerus]|nr:hypothetical protein [Streptomyces clavuligerus]WDN51769.1 hypothetical protein LL058_07840 [Streptomyces clavuligerus]
MSKAGSARHLVMTVGVTLAMTVGGLLTAPAAQADESTPMTSTPAQTAPPAQTGEGMAPTTQTFDGEYVVEGGASMFAGNCFNARSLNVASRQYWDCGVERAALNISGETFADYQAEHLYLGNTFNVRGGTINLAGGVYEGNRFIANTIIIRGNALFVGRNSFEGQVVVKDPEQVAGEIYTGEITPRDADRISHEVDELVNCTGMMLAPFAFGRLDTAGEFANVTPNGEIAIHNLMAAGNDHDPLGRCADDLRRDEFAQFSAIATVDGPRDAATSSASFTHSELLLFHLSLMDCRDRMNAARPEGPGATLAALLECGESKTVTAKPSDSPAP